MRIINVEKLAKRYKNAKTNAVDSISFRVATGEFFALLGPNGAGKTTTVSILTTILSPTTGLDIASRRDLWQTLRSPQPLFLPLGKGPAGAD